MRYEYSLKMRLVVCTTMPCSVVEDNKESYSNKWQTCHKFQAVIVLGDFICRPMFLQ